MKSYEATHHELPYPPGTQVEIYFYHSQIIIFRCLSLDKLGPESNGICLDGEKLHINVERGIWWDFCT